MKSPAPFSTDCAQPVAELVAHAALQDVEHHFEADVHVRIRDAAGRHRRDVHRQLLHVDVLRRQPRLIFDAIPRSHALPAANDGDAVVMFDELRQIHAQSSHRRWLLRAGNTLQNGDYVDGMSLA